MNIYCECDTPDRKLCQLRAPLGLVARENKTPVTCRLFDIETELSLLRDGEQAHELRDGSRRHG